MSLTSSGISKYDNDTFRRYSKEFNIKKKSLTHSKDRNDTLPEAKTTRGNQPEACILQLCQASPLTTQLFFLAWPLGNDRPAAQSVTKPLPAY